MHISLDSALGRQRRLNSVGESVFQIAPDAAAGYSLRSLTGGDPSVVRVRRESDNGERDFNASGVSSGELVNWVNQQITPPLDLRELTATGRDGPIIEAAAAYSLRNLSDSYTGNVVDVRRSSDGELRPVTAAEVTDGTLVTWVAEEQVGWNVQPTWDVVNGDGVITSQSKTATTSTFSITTTSGASFVRQSSKPSHVIASSGDQVVANITLSGFDAAVSARLRTAGTNIDVAQQTLSNGTADYTFNLTGSGGYFAIVNLEATSGATLTFNSIKVIGKSGYVSKWYDQSTTSGVPNANHAVQTSAASQPKIVNAGVLVSGGLDFDGTNDVLETSLVPPNVATLIGVANWDIINSTSVIIGARDSQNQRSYLAQISSGLTAVGVSASSFAGPSVVAGDDYLLYGSYSGSTRSLSTNGVLLTDELGTVPNNTTQGYSIGAFNNIGTSSGFTTGTIQEVIVYPSDQTDNRTALEANIGEVYGIAGIPAYDDTVNGFVETWYDQSGNGNNATQLTASDQPKIVDAGALVTGGLDFDGVNDRFFTTSAINSTNIAIAAVCKADDNVTQGILSMIDNFDSGSELLMTSGKIRFHINESDLLVTTTITEKNLYFANYDGSVQSLSTNGVVNTQSASETVSVTSVAQVGARLGSGHFNGKIAEIIIYNSDQSANRPAIEANINNQYDIY